MTAAGLPALPRGRRDLAAAESAPTSAATPSGPASVRNEPRPRVTPAEKAAILIAALGPEAAGRILGTMTETHIRQFARAMSRLERIPPSLLEATIAEFLETLGDDSSVRGGAEQARALIGKALDDASVARIMDAMHGGASESLWEELAACPDAALASFLQLEHPQTSAVILAELRTDKAARVLERLEPGLAQVIVLRMSRIPRVDRDVLALVQEAISRSFISALRREKSTRKPADLVGSLLNNISESARDRFMQTLESEQPDFAQEVLRVMFTFGDITARVEARDVAQVARAVEEEVLMTALKMGQENYPNTVEFILGNISKRLAERMTEDLAQMRDVKRKAGEAAQMEVVKAVQTLAQKGEITLIEQDGPDD